MDSIEKAIVERGLYKRAHDSRDGNSRSGNDIHAKDGKIGNDASEIDNNVAGASHDKDNITEIQSSNYLMFANVFAHDHDKKHAVEKTKTDNKIVNEKNVFSKKELEAYTENVTSHIFSLDVLIVKEVEEVRLEVVVL
ncbi:hypothetical protein Tco_1105571 [Tanacetum coccineum]